MRSHFRSRKGKNASRSTPDILGFDDPPSETESRDELFPVIRVLPTSDQQPTAMYPTQPNPNLFNHQASYHSFQYSTQTPCCLRCDRLVFDQIPHVKCTGCAKVCCYSCSQVYYNAWSGSFQCEHCSLQSCLVATQWVWHSICIYSIIPIYFSLFFTREGIC